MMCPRPDSNGEPTDYACHYGFRRPLRIFDFGFAILDWKRIEDLRITALHPYPIENLKLQIENPFRFVVWTIPSLYALAV